MRADPPDSEDLVVWMLRAVLDAMPGLPPNTIILIEQATRLHGAGGAPTSVTQRAATAPAGRDRQRGRVQLA